MSPPPKCQQLMSDLGFWGMDIFLLADITENRPLTTVTYTILQVWKKHAKSQGTEKRHKCILFIYPWPDRNADS